MDHKLSSHLNAITGSTTDAIISTDSKGIIISWNRAAEIIFQFTSSEMVGKPLWDIIPERFRAAHDMGMARVSSGHPPKVIGSVVELFGLKKNGEEFPIELSLSTWTTDEGKFYGGIIRDITSRKIIETKLKVSEERFRSVMETANDAMITADTKGIILSWNHAAQKIFGHASSDACGKSLTMIIPTQFREAHEKGIERVSHGGPHHVMGKTVELEGLHQNGTHIPIELSLSTWQTGDERFFCGIIRDITERKKHEARILAQQEELQTKANELVLLNDEVNNKNEQLEALSNKLAKYLSRQVFTSIFEGKRDVKIESYRKKLTIFFSDIHGFTELTEKVESEVLTSILNKYLNEMSKIALDHGGTIDKYIGDAIMIFFGDPETLGEKQDAIACLKMAVAMKERLVDLRRDWDTLGISTPLRVRMGVNTGYCTVGNFGSEDRLDYTIVGGPVNAAARLEAAAPIDEILISADTYALVKGDVVCENFGEVEAKGITYPIQTYLVRNLVSNIKKEEEELIAQLKGFNLSINFNELGYTDKLYARELLEKAIKKL